MTENIEVAVIGPELEERMFGAVPPIDYQVLAELSRLGMLPR
jgi:hypothetical protein